MKLIPRILTLTTIWVLLAGRADAAFASFDEARSGYLEQYDQGVQPGCVMGIFGPDSQARFLSAGYASLSPAHRLDRNTQFLVASMSKQFTALALLILADEGKLRLDDPAKVWVPEFEGAVGDATIQELMHQTAGVRDHVNLLVMAGVETLSEVDRPRTLALMARQKGTNFSPGTRSQYSNGNYLMLSEIIQRVSGQPLEAFARNRIFLPLRMSSTYYLGGGQPATLADGHQPRGKASGFRVANDRPATNGSGGLVTTVSDLSKFHRAFKTGARPWNRRILSWFLLPGMLRSKEIAVLPEFGTPYGAGVGLRPAGDDLEISHDGGAEGFRSEYVRMRDTPWGVAVLCNRVDADASALAKRALLDWSGGVEPVPARLPATPPPAPNVRGVDPPLLEALAGEYFAEELDSTYSLTPGQGGFEVEIRSPFLHGKHYQETWGGMVSEEEDVLKSGPLKLQMHRRNGKADLVSLSFGRRVEGIVLKRLDTPGR